MEKKELIPAIRDALRALPSLYRGRWLTSDEGLALLRSGGLPRLPNDAVVRALQASNGAFPRDRYSNKTYLKFVGTAVDGFPCFKDQMKSQGGWNNLRIDPKHFESLRETSSAIDTLVDLYGPILEVDSSDDEEESPESQNTAVSELTEPTVDHQSSTDGTGSSSSSGLMIMCAERLEQFKNDIEEHSLRCRHKLQWVSESKRGYDVVALYRCPFCKTEIRRTSGNKIPSPKKRGPRKSDLSVLVGAAFMESGIRPDRQSEFLGKAGIVAPSNRILREDYTLLLTTSSEIAKDLLADNRREHVQACRTAPNYGGDLVFKGPDDIERSVAVGAICSDGGGTKRAYLHRITGDQHILIICSGVTQKPVYVKLDQVGCPGCSRAVTKSLLLLGVGAQHVDYSQLSLEHEGTCYRNSKHGPAVAEEHAMEEAAEVLLSLPDDQAIFGAPVVSDGDSRGPKKFIQKQRDIVGDAANGIADRLPDKGHFLKTISNALYALPSSLRGKDMLDGCRIKAIIGDITRHIKWCRGKLDAMGQVAFASDEARSTAQEQIYTNALAKVDSIIPHHCGDHSLCSAEDCLFLQLRRHVQAQKRALGTSVSEASIDKEAVQLHAEQGRFRGRYLSLSEQGRRKIAHEIQTRLNRSTIEKVVEQRCSNRCEGFFNQVTKHTDGKRVYMPSTMGRVVDLVAAKASNDDVGGEVLSRMGVGISFVREKKHLSRKRRFQLDHDRKQSPAYILRRKQQKQINLGRVCRESRSASRHKSETLPETEDCKASVLSSVDNQQKKTKQKRKKKPKCGNCGRVGHTRATCLLPDPARERTIRKPLKGAIDVNDVKKWFS